MHENPEKAPIFIPGRPIDERLACGEPVSAPAPERTAPVAMPPAPMPSAPMPSAPMAPGPDAAPATPPLSPQPQAAWQPAATFRAATGAAKAAVVCLAIVATLDVIGALIQLPMASMLIDDAKGIAIEEGTMIALGLGLIAYGLVYLAAFVTTVICYCIWVHHAHRNLPALGAAGLKFTPGWAVGWYFIPVAFLVMPVLAMVELWKASGADSVAGGPHAWKSSKVTMHISLWWGTWLLMKLMGMGSGFSGNAPTGIVISTAMTTIGAALSVVCAATAIQLIRAIDRRQLHRAAVLSQPAAAMPVAQAA